jgi:hypothetical protein
MRESARHNPVIGSRKPVADPQGWATKFGAWKGGVCVVSLALFFRREAMGGGQDPCN